jgi:Domain of unknown function (DUF4844)
MLNVTVEAFAKLDELKSQPKYIDEPGTSYNGLRPENARQLAEAQLNALIDRLREELPRHPTKKFIQKEMWKTRRQFESIDTEDRERLCRYFMQIMDILKVEYSDTLVIQWLYGRVFGNVLNSLKWAARRRHDLQRGARREKC